jgi:uncharacterized protein DUF998
MTTFRKAAGACGIVAFVTFNVGWIAGDLMQPAAFSPARDDISDLGSLTAASPWLYDRLAANLSGVLLIVLALGLWRTLGSHWTASVGCLALLVVGAGMFLDGIFRLDCQGIDVGCVNDSWHSHAHKLESSVTLAATFVALISLALALRKSGGFRSAWLPVLAAVPGVFVANIAFSVFGAGAATRAGTVVVFAGFASVAARLFLYARVDAPVRQPDLG